MGVTALSKIQARALTEDPREDILLNAVSGFLRLLSFLIIKYEPLQELI